MEVDQLGAARAAAEAALRERWGPEAHVEAVSQTDREDDAERWAAHGRTPMNLWISFGPTPIAAVLTLAARMARLAGGAA